MLRKIQFMLIISGFAVTAYAQQQTLGDLANRVMIPISGLEEVLYTICYIIGGAITVGSLVQFKLHRDNPSQVRLSTPLLLLILGLALVLIPWGLSYYQGNV